MDDAAFRRVVLFGDLEAVKKAVALDPQRLARANPGGFTPLHVLMTEDRPEAAEVLIEAGASVHARNEAGMTPLHLGQSPRVVAVLLRHGADIEARCIGGATPLLIQAEGQLDSGSLEVMTALIRAGANVTARTDTGKSALDVATLRAEPEKIALLEAALSAVAPT